MEPKDLATLIVAVLGLLVAASNFIMARAWADRSYSVSFLQDATAWAVKVLNLFNKAHFLDWLNWEEHRDTIKQMSLEAAALYDEGQLLFPVDTLVSKTTYTAEEISTWNNSGLNPRITLEGNRYRSPHPVLLQVRLLDLYLAQNGVVARKGDIFYVFVQNRNDFIKAFNSVAGVERRARTATRV
jgi:hypothetical protein